MEVRPFNKLTTTSVLTMGLLVANATYASNMSPLESQYWQNYLTSRSTASSEPDLRDDSLSFTDAQVIPNFSYVGYQFGEQALPELGSHTIIDVSNAADIDESLGNVYNSSFSLELQEQNRTNLIAIIDYVATLNEATIIYFPAGDYLLHDEGSQWIDYTDPNLILKDQSYRIKSSNTVIRGAGQGLTRLLMNKEFLPTNPSEKYSTPPLFHITSGKSYSTKANVVATILQDTTRTLTVDNATPLKVGDWVRLRGLNSDKTSIAEAVSPYQPSLLWTGIKNNLDQRELHQIESIQDNDITFKTPIHVNISSVGNWTLDKVTLSEEVGVQDLSFVAAWDGDFVHHGSALDDSGYTFLTFAKVANAWVKNVQVSNANQGIYCNNCVATTIQDVLIDGVQGHMSLAIEYSSGVLGINIDDQANTWHTPGFSHYSSNNVLSNISYSATSSPNIHASQPKQNLFDNMTGGWINNHWGGDSSNQPNHLKHLWFWNNTQTAATNENFEFMLSSGTYGRIIMPYVIGLQGNVHGFGSQKDYYDYVIANNYEDTNYQYPESLPDVSQVHSESLGAPVKPYSLYEAQLKQRQGRLPDWYVEATNMARYVKFTATSGAMAATGYIQVLDRHGYPIEGTAVNVSFASYPTEVVVDLSALDPDAYYRPSGIRFYPTSTEKVLGYDIAYSADQVQWQDVILDGVFSGEGYSELAMSDSSVTPAPVSSSSAGESTLLESNNVLDGDINSVWSESGDTGNKWLALDLGKSKWINAAQIAFAWASSGRQYNFDLDTSMDGSTWVSAGRGLQSSGTTNDLETFKFSLVQARYIKITGFGHEYNGTHESNNAYSEVEVTNCEAPEGGLVVGLSLADGQGDYACDSSGNNHHASLVGKPTWEVWANSDDVLRFNNKQGTETDQVEIADIAYDPVDAKFSVSLWAKFDTHNDLGYLVQAAKWTSDTPFALLTNVDGEIRAVVNGSAAVAAGAANNQWHHIVATLDNSLLSLYVDGVLADSTTVTPTSKAGVLTLGGTAEDNTLRKYIGKMKKVKVFERVLSAAGVSSEYNN